MNQKKVVKKKKIYPELSVSYVPFSCCAIEMKHYELMYRGPDGTFYNLFCFVCGDAANEGVKLLRYLIKNYTPIKPKKKARRAK